MVERKLYKTKLCKLFMTRGHCPRQVCSFAHGDMELRQFMGSFNGRRDNQGGDLRDKLDRRNSTQRRHSPGRDARGRHSFHGHSPSSLEKSSDRKHKRKQLLDDRGVFSGSFRNSDGNENRAKEQNMTSSSSKDNLQDQLKQVLSDIDMLDQHKLQLGVNLEEAVQEVDSLTSKIQELESQLYEEKDECKRITSKIKKFVKAHNRHSRIQGELKRSQVRLQKLGEQLGSEVMRFGSNEEDLNIDIVSEEENAALHVNPQTELQRDASLSKKRPRIDRNVTEESKEAKGVYQAEIKKYSRWSSHPSQSNDKEVEAVNNGSNGHTTIENESKQKKMKTVSACATDANKSKALELELLVPTTSMAAHAIDEEVDIEAEEDKIEVVEAATGIEKVTAYVSKGLPILIPMLPPIRRNSYSQYEGNDVEVDVDGLEDETVDVDIV